MNRKPGLFDGFTELIVHDRNLTAKMTMFFCALMLVFCLTGITIWPAVFTFSTATTAIGRLCNAIKLANAILLVVFVLLSTILLWFDTNYSFLKNATINLSLGWVVNFCVLLFNNAFAQSSVTSNVMIKLLWFTVSILLGLALAILPAAIVAGIAKLIHSLFNFYDKSVH